MPRDEMLNLPCYPNSGQNEQTTVLKTVHPYPCTGQSLEVKVWTLTYFVVGSHVVNEVSTKDYKQDDCQECEL